LLEITCHVGKMIGDAVLSRPRSLAQLLIAELAQTVLQFVEAFGEQVQILATELVQQLIFV
jgi:hypothetical protein